MSENQPQDWSDKIRNICVGLSALIGAGGAIFGGYYIDDQAEAQAIRTIHHNHCKPGD